MRIDVAAYINQLLFEHDCIIIPGFGGFITNYQPATIDYAQGFLHPPTKSITFNQNLTLNDGLLINYIARKEFISYEEARTAVEAYGKECKQKLNRKEILPIPKVGKLYNDVEHKLQFLPDSTNFRTESFGLPKLQYYPILRSKSATPVKQQVAKASPKPLPVVQPKAVAVPRPFSIKKYAPYGAAASILVLVGILSLYLINLDFGESWSDKETIASAAPTKSANKSKFIPFPSPLDTKELDTKELDAEKAVREDLEEVAAVSRLSEEDINKLTDSIKEEDNEVEKVKDMSREEFKAKNANIKKTLNNKKGHEEYRVSVGSFGSKTNANNLTTKINAGGYDTEINKNGRLFRVELIISCKPRDLKKNLENIRSKYSKNAFVI